MAQEEMAAPAAKPDAPAAEPELPTEVIFEHSLFNRVDDGVFRQSPDGEAVFATEVGVDAEFSVSTYDGEFETEFPVVLQSLQSRRELRFELGEGGASVRLQAFDGAIRLVRSR